MKAGWISYTGLIVASSGLSFFKMIVYAKLMEPELFGIVSMLLGSYAVLVIVGSIGMVDGSLKRASMTKEHDQHGAMMGTALTGGMITTSAISALAIGLLAAFDDTVSTVLAIAFFFLVLAAFAFNICEIFLRAAMRFSAFAWAVFAKSVLSLVLGTLVVYSGYSTAVIATEIMAFVLVFLWFQWPLSWPLGFRRPDVARYVELVRAGISISVSSIIKKLSFVADRWLILFLFGPELLGRYAFLMLFYLLGISAVGVINTALGPTLLRKMTDHAHRDVISHTSKLVAKLVLPATVLGCVAVLTIFRPIVDAYFPQYSNDQMVHGAALVVCGVGFMAAQALLEWLLIGQDLSHRLILANATALLVMFAAFGIAALFSASLIVLSAIFTATRITSFTLVLWYIVRSRRWVS